MDPERWLTSKHLDNMGIYCYSTYCYEQEVHCPKYAHMNPMLKSSIFLPNLLLKVRAQGVKFLFWIDFRIVVTNGNT